MNDAEKLRGIEERVRPTICPTYSSDGGERIEGRISKEDFEDLIGLLVGQTGEINDQIVATAERVYSVMLFGKDYGKAHPFGREARREAMRAALTSAAIAIHNPGFVAMERAITTVTEIDPTTERAQAVLDGMAHLWFAESGFDKVNLPEPVVRMVKQAHAEGLYRGRCSAVDAAALAANKDKNDGR